MGGSLVAMRTRPVTAARWLRAGADSLIYRPTATASVLVGEVVAERTDTYPSIDGFCVDRPPMLYGTTLGVVCRDMVHSTTWTSGSIFRVPTAGHHGRHGHLKEDNGIKCRERRGGGGGGGDVVYANYVFAIDELYPS